MVGIQSEKIPIYFRRRGDDKMNKIELGSMIRQHRRLKPMTMQQLATSAGLSLSQLQIIETGKTKNNPLPQTLANLIDALDLDAYERSQIRRIAGLSADIEAPHREALTDDESRILEKVRRLPPDFRDEVERFLDGVVNVLNRSNRT